mmetsp:Transcript_118072/g.345818  ORF Transcript_118072/g.345818 Transcript_118072/m.345818 type:complete len:255 (-) Transcript_118072:132-896(-)
MHPLHEPPVGHVQDLLRVWPLGGLHSKDPTDQVHKLLRPGACRQSGVARRADRVAQRIEVRVGAVEGGVACGELVEGAAQAPDVRAEGVALASNDLRRHVEGRAHARERALRLGGHGLGEAEVAQLRLPALAQEHVRGLDVPMQDPAPVQVGQRAGHVCEPAPEQAFAERRSCLPGVLHLLRERAAGRQLHDEVKVAVMCEVLMVLDEVWVVQRLQQFHLRVALLPHRGVHVEDLHALHRDRRACLHMRGVVQL